MLQNENFGVDFIWDFTSLTVNSGDLVLDLVYESFDLLCSHVVFLLDGFLLKIDQLQDSIALFSHDIFGQFKLLQLLINVFFRSLILFV